MGNKKSETIKPKYEKEMLVQQLRSSFDAYKNKIKGMLDSTWIDDEGCFCMMSDPRVKPYKNTEDQIANIVNDLITNRERDIPNVPIIDMNEIRSAQKRFKVDETINAIDVLLNNPNDHAYCRADKPLYAITINNIERVITFRFSYDVNGPGVNILIPELINRDISRVSTTVIGVTPDGLSFELPEQCCFAEYRAGVYHFRITDLIFRYNQLADITTCMVYVEISYKNK